MRIIKGDLFVAGLHTSEHLSALGDTRDVSLGGHGGHLVESRLWELLEWDQGAGGRSLSGQSPCQLPSRWNSLMFWYDWELGTALRSKRVNGNSFLKRAMTKELHTCCYP